MMVKKVGAVLVPMFRATTAPWTTVTTIVLIVELVRENPLFSSEALLTMIVRTVHTLRLRLAPIMLICTMDVAVNRLVTVVRKLETVQMRKRTPPGPTLATWEVLRPTFMVLTTTFTVAPWYSRLMRTITTMVTMKPVGTFRTKLPVNYPSGLPLVIVEVLAPLLEATIPVTLWLVSTTTRAATNGRRFRKEIRVLPM